MPDGSPETFDFVIVGAGSVGCVLANRLTENGRTTVLLLEYGGSDRSVVVQMPSALSIPMNRPRHNWGYETEPEPHLSGRYINTPRGKVLGGSSSINGLVYVRGNPFDFDRWHEEGARGWAYRDVLPYFKRSETRAEGGDLYRGSDGPLHTCYGALNNPLHRVFIAAARQAGYPETQDINGYQQEGFGRMDMTVHAGRRWSTANAYLKPALRRPNLDVPTAALATRLLAEGRRITGVRYRLGASAGAACRRGCGRADQFAPDPAAVRRGTGGGAAGARDPGRARPAGRRPQSPGPPRILLPGRLHTADHPLPGAEPVRQGARRRALAPAPRRARGHQPLRERRFHPQPGG